MLSLLNTTFTNTLRQGFSLVSSLLNKLKKRVADDGGTFENEACTEAELKKLNKKGLLSKVTVLTTPTAYNVRKLYSIKPEGLGDEFVTNGDFSNGDTGWVKGTAPSSTQQVVNGSLVTYSGSASDSNNALSRTDTLQGYNNKMYKLELSRSNFVNGSIGYLRLDGAYDSSNIISFSEGTSIIYFTAYRDFTHIRFFASSAESGYTIDNVSVKEVLNADFETDRGSLATRVNEQGYIDATLANAEPRIDYLSGCGSFLLEPTRTNIQIRSEEFDNSVWNKTRSSITSNDATSPSGLLNADTLEGVSGTTSYVYDGISVASGSVYTISVFAKYIDIEEFIINVFGQSGQGNFNISNGTVTSSTGTVTEPKIENYGNGWYRCSVKFTANATGNVNYGFLLSNGIGKSVNIWGAQFELGSYPTSYIPTTTAAVTRNAESANDAGSPTLFNDLEGVLMAEISALANDGTFRFLSVSDGTTSNRINIMFNTNNTLDAFVGAVGTFDSVVDILNFNKAAIKYKSGDYAFWVNGFEVEVSTSTSGTHSGLNQLNFDIGNGSNDFYGNTKQIQYYNSALTDSELEALTSWVSFSDMANAQLYTIQ